MTQLNKYGRINGKALKQSHRLYSIERLDAKTQELVAKTFHACLSLSSSTLRQHTYLNHSVDFLIGGLILQVLIVPLLLLKVKLKTSLRLNGGLLRWWLLGHNWGLLLNDRHLRNSMFLNILNLKSLKNHRFFNIWVVHHWKNFVFLNILDL